MKNISILGSTGSIGTQALDIIRSNEDFCVTAISANSNIALLERQIREFSPKYACVCDEEAAKSLKIKVADTNTRIVSGVEGLSFIASVPECDTVLTAVVGICGLSPTIEAIKASKNIALANKETLVTGGHIVMELAKQYKVNILPVDSEHSAIFQSMQGNRDKKEIKKIILTCSGGPFFGKTPEELQKVTKKDALKHPNWSMGDKITIDSSTLANKGLEVIEAKWLFDMSVDNIEVLVHRQSIVHSMVEYIDNGIIAQLGAPDMKLPIQYAFTYPNRRGMTSNVLDFTKYSALTFEKPDMDTFYALKLAYRACKVGGSMPAVFNGADEAAVELFLDEKIKYTEISELIEYAMDSISVIDNPSLDEIFQTDKAAREAVYKKVKEV